MKLVNAQNATRVCDVDRVLLSRAGTAALYRDPAPLLLGLSSPARTVFGSKVVFVDVHGERRALQSRMHLVEPAGWSKDGEQLAVRVGRKVWAVSDGRTNVSIIDDYPAIGPSDRIEPMQWVSLPPSTYASERAQADLRSIAFVGGEGRHSLHVTGEQSSLVLNAEGIVTAHRSPIGITHLRAFNKTGGQVAVTFLGEGTQGSGILHEMPLIDHSRGALVGSFGPRSLTIGSDHLRSKDLPPDAVILDAVFSGAHGAALIEYSDQSRQLFRLDAAGGVTAIQPVCQRPRPAEREHGLQIETVSLPAAGPDHVNPIGFLYRRERPSRCLIIYYHGGPELSLKDSGYFNAYQRLQETQCDLLAVEYSGSVGGGLGLTHQISRFGYRALQLDAESARRWVAAQRKYDRLAIVGVSYGAAPALGAKQLIAGSRLYLVAPVISLEPLRATDENYKSNPLLDALQPGRTPGRSAYDLFERSFYGTSERARTFNQELRRAYVNLGTEDRVYLGRNDRKSSASLLNSVTTKPQVKFFPGDHDTVTGMAALWDDIVATIIEPGQSSSGIQSSRLK